MKKKKYAGRQVKQFALSSVFIAVAAVGMTVSNSFDQEYMAQVEQQKKEKSRIAAVEAKKKDADKDDTGVAMK